MTTATTSRSAAQAKIASEAQKAATSPYVVLYQLDARVLGGDVYCFTQSTRESAPITYGGVEYTPIDLEADGFEWTGAGTLPTPRIRIANANRAMSALVGTYDDLLGATLTRIRTFRRFLDGEPDADPGAHFPLDIYRVERKVALTKTHIEWELSAAMDQEGKMLPGRQVLRDACTHTYRRWTGAGFDYSQATCPYTGSACFKASGDPTGNSAEDDCGRKDSDCKKRFGESAVLPTRAFPGVARVRI